MARIEQLIRPDRVVGGRIAFPLLGVAAACLAFYAHAQMAPKAASLATLPAAMGAVVAVPKPTPLPQPAPRADAVLSMPVLAGSAVAADAADEARMRSAMYTVVDAAATAEAARDAAAAAKAGLNAEASASARAMAVADAEAHGAAMVRRGDGNAYALVRRGSKGMTMSGSTRDIRDVEALRSQINGDFLWVRRGGKAYTITDPAFLARVSDAWTDSEALGKQMDALGREMDVHGQRMNVLGAQMNALSVHHGPTPAMQKSQQRIRELAAQQGALARRQARLGVSMASQDEVAREHTEAEMDKLSAQMDALGEQIDRESDRISDEAEKMTRNAEPMEALGRQMEDAAKPMEALGKRMEALGERQEQLARVAERKVEGAIDEALQRGLARPIEAN